MVDIVKNIFQKFQKEHEVSQTLLLHVMLYFNMVVKLSSMGVEALKSHTNSKKQVNKQSYYRSIGVQSTGYVS